MGELEGTDDGGGDRRFAPALGAALQGPEPDGAGLEVDVLRPDGQGFGDPGAGARERECEGLVGRLRRQGGGGEEALALIGGQVFPAAGVDELEIADQARHFA